MTMDKKLLAKKIAKILDTYFPDPKPPLNYYSTYTLLVAVLLSAQCTDERVNKVTEELFKRADTPQDMMRLGVETLAGIIRPCGLSRRKATAIVSLSKCLVEAYDGEVPGTFEALEALPGVGHKTASVVMVQGFGEPAFPVDTHIHRSAVRWGLCPQGSVVATEIALKELFPKSSWKKLHLQMILFARKFCPARGHEASKCPICRQVMKRLPRGRKTT